MPKMPLLHRDHPELRDLGRVVRSEGAGKKRKAFPPRRWVLRINGEPTRAARREGRGKEKNFNEPREPLLPPKRNNDAQSGSTDPPGSPEIQRRRSKRALQYGY